jgi:hypothetical protein
MSTGTMKGERERAQPALAVTITDDDGVAHVWVIVTLVEEFHLGMKGSRRPG